MAERNNLVMLFPQIHTRDGEEQSDCWDIFGYDGDDFGDYPSEKAVPVRKAVVTPSTCITKLCLTVKHHSYLFLQACMCE